MCDINSVTKNEEVVTFPNDGLSTIEELSHDPHDRSHGSVTLDIDLSSEVPTTAVGDRFDDQPPNKSDNSDFEKVEEHSPALSSTITFDATKYPSKTSVKKKRSIEDEAEVVKRRKKQITFDSVTLFYFPRQQGFTCVPSKGGSTLGMSTQHSQVVKFSIEDHAIQQRRIHRRLILKQLKIDENGSVSENEFSDASSEPEFSSRYFLPRLTPKNRRALLRAAEVRKIDSLDEDECRDLRDSRDNCGCECEDYCDPDSCSCSQNGIKCQVDFLNFPCACTRENCGNTSGRTEFNTDKMRTHLKDTLLRLDLEKTQEDVRKSNKDILSSK
ncbi:unnamed protein product [Ceutorhynchus assimilis]|uniref:Cysteine/serine-rich nuclear protein N-terminal domain-containing protein n=1 Tax=Ceutorhynchus assimilis TaxID=467358 RepID=A0A9N9MVK7_9CUCU|nr:unnamed protein product [Ceutorhynchus assimilis]